ncbi:hypothetical protein UC8_40120 [Roseimaritima ulvae]|uniref:Uncharacterized protein n=2 Tax=Roseimaritima ulvae TaxID=980254 RepID=A0A5B9R6N7_9BACT|nr:hypothetical protein UC8_40120 [Roseimaritima ulvae]
MVTTWRSMLEKWGLSSLRINVRVLDAELHVSQPDRDAAWDLYVELVTRITTQPLGEGDGTEQAALDSVYALFPLTRETIKRHGRHCHQFTRLAVVILNQKIRPFTAAWHRRAEQGAFDDPQQCRAFRAELTELQQTLREYSGLLADLAEVEDLTDLIPDDAS